MRATFNGLGSAIHHRSQHDNPRDRGRAPGVEATLQARRDKTRGRDTSAGALAAGTTRHRGCRVTSSRSPTIKPERQDAGHPGHHGRGRRVACGRAPGPLHS
jgi:hypothetical protein